MFSFANYSLQLCPFPPLIRDFSQLFGQIPNSGVTCNIKENLAQLRDGLTPISSPPQGWPALATESWHGGGSGGHGFIFLSSPSSGLFPHWKEISYKTDTIVILLSAVNFQVGLF